MKRTGSLFHTIVVVGAALGAGAGCGEDEHVPPQPDAPPAVADARRPDAATPDAAPVDGAPDAMIIIL